VSHDHDHSHVGASSGRLRASLVLLAGVTALQLVTAFATGPRCAEVTW
jgi:hypothetical protein